MANKGFKTVTVSNDLHADLQRIANNKGTTMSKLIAVLLYDYKQNNGEASTLAVITKYERIKEIINER